MPLVPWPLKVNTRVRLAVQVTMLTFVGCVNIQGGAVEARWVLRNNNGIAVACDDGQPNIDTVRFVLVPSEGGQDPCAATTHCRFACQDLAGITPFVIPQGAYTMSIQPLGVDQQPLGPKQGVAVPLPTVRQVRKGQLTDLDVNMIILAR